MASRRLVSRLIARHCLVTIETSTGARCGSRRAGTTASIVCRPAFSSLQWQRRWYSSPQDQDIIPEADIVRESTTSLNRNQRRRRQEEERLEQLEQALTHALQRYQEAADDSHQRKRALLDLCHIYESLEYWDQALQLQQVLLDDHCETPVERANALYGAGKLHMRLGDAGPARRCYQQAIGVLQEVMQNNKNENDSSMLSPLMGNVLISMSGLDYYQGRLAESLETLEQAEPWFNNNDSAPHVDLIKCLQHQGLVYRGMNNFENARGKYQQALDVLDQVQDQLDATTCHSKRQSLQLDLADMMAALDDNQQACELYEQILTAHQQFQRESAQDHDDDNALPGIIYHNLGRIHAQSSDTREQALEELTRALSIKQDLLGDTHPECLKTLTALGALYGVLDNKRLAQQCFQQALLLARMHAEDDTDETVMLILRNIAVLKGEKVAKWGEA